MIRGVRVLSMALVACAPGADADIIHFVNPSPGQQGHYDWRWEPVAGWESWLDITAPATAQSGLASGSSVGQVFSTVPDESSVYNRNGAGATIGCSSHFTFGFTSTGYQFGSLIGFTNFWYLTGVPHITDLGDGVSFFTDIPDGSRRYLGVITATDHRGWIEVERTGMNLTAYAWAYQTEPGVPIVAGQVPAPAAAAAVFGLAALLGNTGRRRRC